MHIFPSRMKLSARPFTMQFPLGGVKVSQHNLVAAAQFLLISSAIFPQIERRNRPESVCRCHKQVRKTVGLGNDSSHGDDNKKNWRGDNTQGTAKRAFLGLNRGSSGISLSPPTTFACRNNFFCLSTWLNSPLLRVFLVFISRQQEQDTQ
jgi:hypothetical protein